MNDAGTIAGTAAPAFRYAGPPTHRLEQSFEWNFANGPFFDAAFPEIPRTPLKDFFGIPVNSRFGIAASILPNAKFLDLYSRLGFDLLSYKTVRRKPRTAHPSPNWMYLDEPRTDALEDLAAAQWALPAAAIADSSLATVAGSIGVPSQPPEFWAPDIRRCRELIRPGQALIVSLVGSVGPDTTKESYLFEFEELAAMVREAGAQVVEVNLSCPNVKAGEGEAYRDTVLSGEIAAALRRGAGNLPLLMKVGALEDPDAMSALLRAVDGKMDGVIMMNGLSRVVTVPSGDPAFGPTRVRAGITGGNIYRFAMRQVVQSVEIIRRDHLALKVLGCGGANSPERVQGFLDAGAYAVLSATAPVINPYLAVELKRADPAI